MNKEFEDWLKEKHLDRCPQCQKSEKVKLSDHEAVALYLFKEFYGNK